MRSTFLPLTVALAALLSHSLSCAQDKTWYLVGAVGASSYGGNTAADTDADLVRQGKTNINSTSKGNSTGYKAVLGYQLHPNFSIEGAYVDMGSLGYNASFSGGSMDIDARTTGAEP